jgi:hypothetical protein
MLVVSFGTTAHTLNVELRDAMMLSIIRMKHVLFATRLRCRNQHDNFMNMNRGHSIQLQLHRPWVWVAALTNLAAALRAIGLSKGLWCDEISNVAKSQPW